MSRGLKNGTIAVVLLNQLIIVLAGHGYGFLIFIELSLFSYSESIISVRSCFDSYDNAIPLVASLSMTGQVLLLLSLSLSNNQQTIRFWGISLLLSAYIILSKFSKHDEKSFFSFCSGLPFLIASVWLIVKMWFDKNKKP